MTISNASTWEAEARGSSVQGHPRPLSELQASLDYPLPCLKNKQAGRCWCRPLTLATREAEAG